MIHFLDGPATGQLLMLRRAPRYLRVTKSPRGVWDALDRLDDTPTAEEQVYVYVRVGKKAAGRLLDGREWSEFPASVQTSAP
jgi:hypothetical protein